MSNLKAFNVRLSPETITKISEIAKEQRRSVQTTIEIMVENEYKNIKGETKMKKIINATNGNEAMEASGIPLEKIISCVAYNASATYKNSASSSECNWLITYAE